MCDSQQNTPWDSRFYQSCSRFPKQLKVGMDSEYLGISLSVQSMKMRFSNSLAETKVRKLFSDYPLRWPNFFVFFPGFGPQSSLTLVVRPPSWNCLTLYSAHILTPPSNQAHPLLWASAFSQTRQTSQRSILDCLAFQANCRTGPSVACTFRGVSKHHPMLSSAGLK